MIRPLLLAAAAALLGVLGWLALTREAPIAIEAAVAHPAGGREGLWMLEAAIRNAGPPDRLLGFEGDAARLVNVDAPGLAVVVPGGGEASLAMDGAHGMLLASGEPGGFVPLTLLFERAGAVALRARLGEAPAMAHGGLEGREAAPAPAVALSVPGGVSADGFTLAIETAGIALRQVEEGAPHVPGEGHAHVYLNGLKLGRLYADTFGVGALAPGDYVLRVALTGHDHRPYLSEGAPVEAVLTFALP